MKGGGVVFLDSLSSAIVSSKDLSFKVYETYEDVFFWSILISNSAYGVYLRLWHEPIMLYKIKIKQISKITISIMFVKIRFIKLHFILYNENFW